MPSWRDDPDLVRQPEEDLLQEVIVTAQWEELFSTLEVMFAGDGLGIKDRMLRATMKGMLFQAKKKVAADPDNARAYVIGSMHAIAACLRIEPRELYPDLKPAEPAVVK